MSQPGKDVWNEEHRALYQLDNYVTLRCHACNQSRPSPRTSSWGIAEPINPTQHSIQDVLDHYFREDVTVNCSLCGAQNVPHTRVTEIEAAPQVLKVAVRIFDFDEQWHPTKKYQPLQIPEDLGLTQNQLNKELPLRYKLSSVIAHGGQGGHRDHEDEIEEVDKPEEKEEEIKKPRGEAVEVDENDQESEVEEEDDETSVLDDDEVADDEEEEKAEEEEQLTDTEMVSDDEEEESLQRRSSESPLSDEPEGLLGDVDATWDFETFDTPKTRTAEEEFGDDLPPELPLEKDNDEDQVQSDEAESEAESESEDEEPIKPTKPTKRKPSSYGHYIAAVRGQRPGPEDEQEVKELPTTKRSGGCLKPANVKTENFFRISDATVTRITNQQLLENPQRPTISFMRRGYQVYVMTYLRQPLTDKERKLEDMEVRGRMKF